MRSAACVIIALALPCLLAACLYEDFHDGAFCSDKATCPPGQRCSPDGYCLFPCPVPDCTGDTCGCEPLVEKDWQLQRLCWDDGLCHLMCDQGACSHSGFLCDTRAEECVLPCEANSDCVNGASCVSTDGEAGTVCRGL